MKKQSAKILVALVLLMSFITGQAIVFGHSHFDKHLTEQSEHSKPGKAKTADETCKICHLTNAVTPILYEQSLTIWLNGVSFDRPEAPQVAYNNIPHFYAFDRGPPAV